MFYCNECAKENTWPETVFKSRGKCEICGESADCSDLPSSSLSKPKSEEDMSNVGKEIKDFYCNGFAGRRYDLAGSRIEAEGHDWIVIRLTDGKSEHINFDGWNKQEHIDTWCNEKEEE